MRTTYKCKYSHCLHESKEIPCAEAIKVGNAYYHQDCLEYRNDIQEITDMFIEYINPSVVRNVLFGVVNTIVFSRGVAPDYLKFGLNYYINHNMKLQYPQGLYYVIQNQEVKKAYDALNVREEKKTFVISENNTIKESDFTFTPTKQKGFGDILK